MFAAMPLRARGWNWYLAISTTSLFAGISSCLIQNEKGSAPGLSFQDAFGSKYHIAVSLLYNFRLPYPIDIISYHSHWRRQTGRAIRLLCPGRWQKFYSG